MVYYIMYGTYLKIMVRTPDLNFSQDRIEIEKQLSISKTKHSCGNASKNSSTFREDYCVVQ